MNIIDIVILACLLPFAFTGLFRGLISQIIGILVVVTSIYLSSLAAPQVGQWLLEMSGWSEQVCSVVAFVLIFIACAIACGIVGKLLEKIIRFAHLGPANRLAGMLFGIGLGLLVLSLLSILFEALNGSFSFVEAKTLEESVLFRSLQGISAWVCPKLGEMFPPLGNLLNA